jgi:hypothetical protein
MAKIEIATLDDLKENHVNISDIVGVGEKNERNDVMLIQTLFKIIGNSDTHAKAVFGLAAKDLPEPTGDFDEKTIRAIWGFQRKMSYRLLNVDGKIHPASYKDRVIKKAFKGGRLMAITLLNMEAIDQTVMLSTSSVPEAVKKITPAIIFI